jgi:hypothetical protein
MNLLYIENEIKKHKKVDFISIVNENNRDFSTISNPFSYLISFIISIFLSNILGVSTLIHNGDFLNIVFLIWAGLTFYILKSTPKFYKGYKFYKYEKKLIKSYPELHTIYKEVFFIRYMKTKTPYVSSFAMFLKDLKDFKSSDINNVLSIKNKVIQEKSTNDIDFN